MSELMKQEAARLLYFLSASALLGFFTGHPGWSFAAGFLAYIILHLRQVERLQRWLKGDPDAELPAATGAWGEIFDGIHALRRDEQRAQANLRGIIERARTSVAALKEAVVLVDGHGNLEWWNPAAEKLLGLRMATDLGQPVTNLIRDPSFIRYFEQGPYDEALQLPSIIHPARQLQFNLTRFGSNERLMIVADITRLHNLEQMRKDFVANVSHELRTPLTVLTGYLETLLAQQEGVDGRWQRALQQMDAQAQRMNNLVNDLLLLSRLENDSRKQEPRVVNVPPLLAQLKNEAIAFGMEKHQEVTLECDDTLRLLGREDELRSAFSNLVTNAVKYTQAGGRIHMRWWSDASHVYFSVQDNGLGIDARHIPRLTERFYRTDEARSTATGGTGLGLAIVKHVLIDHQARLDIQSSFGKGSTFTCVFPGKLAIR
ncbi:MAG TPA: phosphate regulon sensor histidine kinase PhoR [Moraxellaceae bacterium]|nr:phosphate regulon sensor histidine kinase PhoR [Moraxellaceae bacterium]